MNSTYLIALLLIIICIAVFIMFNQAVKIGYYEQKFRNRKHLIHEDSWKYIQRMMDTNFPLLKKWFHE
jgi:hypothetical protein